VHDPFEASAAIPCSCPRIQPWRAARVMTPSDRKCALRARRTAICSAQVLLDPRREHPAHAVMVAERPAELDDLLHHRVPELDELLQVLRAQDQDEVRFVPCGRVRGVGHAHRPGPALHEFANASWDPVQVLPGHAGLELVETKAEIETSSRMWMSGSAVLPTGDGESR